MPRSLRSRGARARARVCVWVCVCVYARDSACIFMHPAGPAGRGRPSPASIRVEAAKTCPGLSWGICPSADQELGSTRFLFVLLRVIRLTLRSVRICPSARGPGRGGPGGYPHEYIFMGA